MNAHHEKRRSPRRRAESVIEVTDSISGRPVGRVVDLSVEGMMLLVDQPVVNDALYQFTFPLPLRGGGTRTIEVGVHEQWTDRADMPGHYWAGFRIIDILADDAAALAAWLDGHASA